MTPEEFADWVDSKVDATNWNLFFQSIEEFRAFAAERTAQQKFSYPPESRSSASRKKKKTRLKFEVDYSQRFEVPKELRCWESVAQHVAYSNYIAELRGCKETITVRDWVNICTRHDFLCAICKRRLKLQIDHITPVTKGGRHIVENLQPLCCGCNVRKGNKEPTKEMIDSIKARTLSSAKKGPS